MHPKEALVSIILPFYQVGEEFNHAIESIVQQTFTHWKLILVSNNGNDQGREIAGRWSDADHRILQVEEHRQGIAHALNAGISLADTPYIARMDADDSSHPKRLAVQYEYLEKNKHIDVVSSQTVFQSELGISLGYSLFVDWQNTIITPQEHFMSRFIESPLAHPSVMFRTKLIQQFGGYSTRNVPEDYELWLRWMDQGINFHKLPEPLLTWNDHADRLSRNHDNYSREAFFQIKCEYLARWIKQHVSPNKKIVVCGSSRIGRKRADLLQQLGVDIFGFTDVRKRPNRQVNFIHIHELSDPGPWFLVNFIARRGVGQAIKEHFISAGFREGVDFILAA